jgi:hypothetical protein
MLPNFLIIGAARCGTTTLYEYLQEHPDIYLPKSKRPEPHFFLKEKEYKKTIHYYSQKYFSDVQEQKAIGEASTSYICHEFVAERIQNHLPDVKLIVMLRHPVERAYSNYWHTVKSGLETVSFEEAVLTERGRLAAITDPTWLEIEPFAYVKRGFYYKQLKTYLQYFARSQILVLLLDDLERTPLNTMSSVYDFLGVDNSFLPSSLGRIDNRSTPEGVEISCEIRSLLIDQYKNDLEKLEGLLGRSLQSWKH